MVKPLMMHCRASHTVPMLCIAENPSRKPHPLKGKTAHRGAQARCRGASGKPRLQAMMPSGKNPRRSTTARQSPLLPQTQCTRGSNTGGQVITGGFTVPLTAVGAVVGFAVGGPIGAVVGAAIGSEFGFGATGSYVPSTGNFYVGVTGTVSPLQLGRSSVSASDSYVPSGQDPDAIANGASLSATFLGSNGGAVVTKSPGNGPSVVGVQGGTRAPATLGASFNVHVPGTGC
jgi:hypothetical protein